MCFLFQLEINAAFALFHLAHIRQYKATQLTG